MTSHNSQQFMTEPLFSLDLNEECCFELIKVCPFSSCGRLLRGKCSENVFVLDQQHYKTDRTMLHVVVGERQFAGRCSIDPWCQGYLCKNSNSPTPICDIEITSQMCIPTRSHTGVWNPGHNYAKSHPHWSQAVMTTPIPLYRPRVDPRMAPHPVRTAASSQVQTYGSPINGAYAPPAPMTHVNQQQMTHANQPTLTRVNQIPMPQLQPPSLSGSMTHVNQMPSMTYIQPPSLTQLTSGYNLAIPSQQLIPNYTPVPNYQQPISRHNVPTLPPANQPVTKQRIYSYYELMRFIQQNYPYYTSQQASYLANYYLKQQQLNNKQSQVSNVVGKTNGKTGSNNSATTLKPTQHTISLNAEGKAEKYLPTPKPYRPHRISADNPQQKQSHRKVEYTTFPSRTDKSIPTLPPNVADQKEAVVRANMEHNVIYSRQKNITNIKTISISNKNLNRSHNTTITTTIKPENIGEIKHNNYYYTNMPSYTHTYILENSDNVVKQLNKSTITGPTPANKSVNEKSFVSAAWPNFWTTTQSYITTQPTQLPRIVTTPKVETTPAPLPAITTGRIITFNAVNGMNITSPITKSVSTTTPRTPVTPKPPVAQTTTAQPPPVDDLTSAKNKQLVKDADTIVDMIIQGVVSGVKTPTAQNPIWRPKPNIPATKSPLVPVLPTSREPGFRNQKAASTPKAHATTEPSPMSSSPILGQGALIGVVTGAAIALIIALILIVCLCRRHRRKCSSSASSVSSRRNLSMRFSGGWPGCAHDADMNDTAFRKNQPMMGRNLLPVPPRPPLNSISSHVHHPDLNPRLSYIPGTNIQTIAPDSDADSGLYEVLPGDIEAADPMSYDRLAAMTTKSKSFAAMDKQRHRTVSPMYNTKTGQLIRKTGIRVFPSASTGASLGCRLPPLPHDVTYFDPCEMPETSPDYIDSDTLYDDYAVSNRRVFTMPDVPVDHVTHVPEYATHGDVIYDATYNSGMCRDDYIDITRP